MSSNNAFKVLPASWAEDGPALAAVRTEVFIQEQSVPQELEMDGKDPHCEHVKAVAENGEVIGTGRLLPDGKIGRVAVLKPWRSHGVGVALIKGLLAVANEKNQKGIYLESQCQAIGFYEKLGFVAEGDVFLDAGIEHRTMRIPDRD